MAPDMHSLWGPFQNQQTGPARPWHTGRFAAPDCSPNTAASWRPFRGPLNLTLLSRQPPPSTNTPHSLYTGPAVSATPAPWKRRGKPENALANSNQKSQGHSSEKRFSCSLSGRPTPFPGRELGFGYLAPCSPSQELIFLLRSCESREMKRVCGFAMSSVLREENTPENEKFLVACPRPARMQADDG